MFRRPESMNVSGAGLPVVSVTRTSSSVLLYAGLKMPSAVHAPTVSLNSTSERSVTPASGGGWLERYPLANNVATSSRDSICKTPEKRVKRWLDRVRARAGSSTKRLAAASSKITNTMPNLMINA